jgi:hypothetical protein
MIYLEFIAGKICSYLLCAVALLLLLGTAVHAEWTELVSLPFGVDNKDWEIGWSNKTERSAMYEFVPKGQTVQNWKELVTLQFYPGMQDRSAADFMKSFLALLQSDEPLAKAEMISSSPDDTMMEWNVLGSKQNADQFELDRVIRGKQGLHMIHYAVKTSSFSSADRSKWLNFLRSAKLSDQSHQPQQ